MKQNFLLATLCLGLGLFVASCSKNELRTKVGDNEVIATFSISTPGTMTKAQTAGKGETVDKVQCVVFDDQGNEIAALSQNLPIVAKKATFSTRLVKGQAYRVAFFAYKDGVYNVSDLKNITLEAASQAANSESRDAFTAFVDISATDTESPISKTIPLYRPFAQLNIACTAADFAAAEAAGISIASSSVSLGSSAVAFETFSAYEDKVTGTAIDQIDFTDAAIIAGEELTVEGVTYKSLSMNYILVGDRGEKNTADVSFSWKSANGKTGSATFSAVPFQRNWRTNIIGDLLTNPAAFNIYIDDPFDDEFNLVNVVSTPDQLDAALSQGGVVTVAANVGDIDLVNVQADEPITLKLESNVGTISLGDSHGTVSPAVTIEVGAGVDFPELVLGDLSEQQNSSLAKGYTQTLKDVTIKADPDAGVCTEGISFSKKFGLVENLTIEGVKFDGSKNTTANNNGAIQFENFDVGAIKNLVIKDCSFTGMTGAHGIRITRNNSQTDVTYGPGEFYAKVEGCTIDFSDSKNPGNGISVLNATGPVLVSGNTLINSIIDVCNESEVEISNNTVTATDNCIKVRANDEFVNPGSGYVWQTKMFTNISIHDNTVNATGASQPSYPYGGIYICWGSGGKGSIVNGTSHVAHIKDNVINAPNRSGIWFLNDTAEDTTVEMHISGNTFDVASGMELIDNLQNKAAIIRAASSDITL